jgi:pseudaminic acid synthase
MNIRVGKHTLGQGCPIFVVAEMSGNHGGSLERAIEIVRSAKRAGAHAIKLQTYTADTITYKCDGDAFRIPDASPWSKFVSLWDLYDKAHTPWAWHEEIFAEARRLGLEVFSSPFDSSAVELLEKLDSPAYKIASPEITDIPLLECVAQTGKPIIISTGVANLSDIELALATLRDSGAKDIILLKCTSAYPAPPEEANLRTIADMTLRFGVLSGLSDHTMGSACAVAAAALGACLIEKHFALDDDEETVDSFFSMKEAEFSKMVEDIRWVEQALGEVTYDLTPGAVNSLRARRSLYVVEPIKRGEAISASNIRSLRPAAGLHPKFFKELIGRRLNCDLRPGDPLTEDVLE